LSRIYDAISLRKTFALLQQQLIFRIVCKAEINIPMISSSNSSSILTTEN